jgi:hypothetical protein
LFYSSGLFKRPLSVDIPIVQLNVENKVNSEGKIKIKCKMVDFALILFGIANGSIIFLALFNFDPYRTNDITPQVAFIMLVLSYGVLLFTYLIELSGFKREMEQLELRQY